VTAAHELASHCLETGDDPATFTGMWVDIRQEDGKLFVELDEPPAEPGRYFEVDDEMADGVGLYVEHVRSLHESSELCFVDVEQRLDMTHLHPEIFGTSDATVLDAGNRHLHVVDLKYGKGLAVDDTDNPQLLLYAAGAARRHHNAQIEKLTMWIVQPRAPHPKGPIREYEIDLIDLFDFEHDLARAATATESPDAPLVAGDWCWFCPAQPVCPAARVTRVGAAAEEFGEIGEPVTFTAPEKLSPERLAALLREADAIGNYVKAVQEHAHAQAMGGHMPDGFKLVPKRATRKWKDEAEALASLTRLKVSKAEAYTEPKLRSPAQLEKFFPGRNKDQRQAAMADLVVKQSSGFNLVPVEDPRPAANIGAGADFEAVDV
jgi:hypothetical protein